MEEREEGREASDNYKKYQIATKVRAFGKAKGKGSGPPVPESMPKKPLDAFHAFKQDQANAGKGAPLQIMMKRFSELTQDEKQRYLTEASERANQYKAEMEAFEKSPIGRRYLLGKAAFIKR